jgi:hypothetical protein
MKWGGQLKLKNVMKSSHLHPEEMHKAFFIGFSIMVGHAVLIKAHLINS